MRLCRLGALALLIGLLAPPVFARAAAPQSEASARGEFQTLPDARGAPSDPVHFDWEVQWNSLLHAFISLPLAAALGAALAFRPRRRGTPLRSAPVIQTQLILSIVGAIVMLIVGASLARAFGIVGAASLVRYRAKIDDPKDAGVMLTTLGVGLASGVGLYLLAVFGTAFVIGVLWVIESLEPRQRKVFHLQVTTKDPQALRASIEQQLRRHRLPFELRSSSHEQLAYEVLMPFDLRTDRLSNEILALDESGETAVEWEEKKK